MEAATASLLETRTSVPMLTSLLIFSVAGLFVATIAKKSFSFDMVITFVMLSALVAVSIWLGKLTKHRIPAIVSGMTLGALATSPISPIGKWLSHTAESVNFLSIITAMLHTEAINGRLEHLRGSALGFRNLTNYIARSILEAGGFRPRLHPGLG